MVCFQVSASENNSKLWGQFFWWLCIKTANKDLCFIFCCMFLLIWWFYMSEAVMLGNSLGRKQEVGLGACLHCQDMDLTTQDGCSQTRPFAHCIWGCWNLDMYMCVHLLNNCVIYVHTYKTNNIYILGVCSGISNSLWLSGLQPARLTIEFSRKEYWSGLPFPSRDLPNPGIKPASPALKADSLLLSHWGSPYMFTGRWLRW